jgi:hypothetical protein
MKVAANPAIIINRLKVMEIHTTSTRIYVSIHSSYLNGSRTVNIRFNGYGSGEDRGMGLLMERKSVTHPALIFRSVVEIPSSLSPPISVLLSKEAILTIPTKINAITS